jgi:hypothetical protein
MEHRQKKHSGIRLRHAAVTDWPRPVPNPVGATFLLCTTSLLVPSFLWTCFACSPYGGLQLSLHHRGTKRCRLLLMTAPRDPLPSAEVAEARSPMLPQLQRKHLPSQQ